MAHDGAEETAEQLEAKHLAAEQRHTRQLALDSGEFIAMLPPILFEAGAISAERRAELEAFSRDDLGQHLGVSELMDLAISWGMVRSGADFWKAHKHKNELVAALYDTLQERLAAAAAAGAARDAAAERAHRERVAAAEAEAAEAARARAPRPRAGSSEGGSEAPHVAAGDGGRSVVEAILHPESEAAAAAPPAAGPLPPERARHGGEAAEAAAVAAVGAEAAAAEAAVVEPAAKAVAAAAEAGGPPDAALAGAAADAREAAAPAAPAEGARARAAAAKEEAAALTAKSRALRSPLTHMRALLLKNLPDMARALSSGGAIAARKAASAFVTSWFARRGKEADALARAAELKRQEARALKGGAAACSPAQLAELLCPRSGGGGGGGVAVLPLEELLARAPQAERPLGQLFAAKAPRGGAAAAAAAAREEGAAASTARIDEKAAALGSRAEAGPAAALAALDEIEALKTAVKKSTGGSGFTRVTLEALREPAARGGGTARASPARPRAPLYSPPPPPPPAAERPGTRAAATARAAGSPRRGAGGLSQSKDAASRPRFPEGGDSLVSALVGLPAGAPPILDVPPEAVPFLRAVGLEVGEVRAPRPGARAPGPWPAEMFSASQFGVGVSDDAFPSARRQLDSLRKEQKREQEVKALKKAYRCAAGEPPAPPQRKV
jgi:hypothetical protein